jgi:hypothetical protein
LDRSRQGAKGKPCSTDDKLGDDASWERGDDADGEPAGGETLRPPIR